MVSPRSYRLDGIVGAALAHAPLVVLAVFIDVMVRIRLGVGLHVANAGRYTKREVHLLAEQLMQCLVFLPQARDVWATKNALINGTLDGKLQQCSSVPVRCVFRALATCCGDLTVALATVV